jgi:hypothetical protein
MTQGPRNSRFAATVRLVRAALLLSLFLVATLSSAQQPGDPPTDVPEGPPFAPSLKPDLLALVRDNSGMPRLSPNADDPKAMGEFLAYLDAVKNAKQTSVEGFANTVRKEVSVGHVLLNPKKYRGTVIRVEGNLRRVRELDAPVMLAQAGVEKLYEGWLFNRDMYADKPICIVFTDLPDGVPLGEKLDDPPRVTFDGYFFKVYRYEAADPKKPDRIAPLLIGHAPVLVDTARQVETTSFWQPLIAGVLGVIALALVGALGLAWWFSRGDMKVSRQLADASARQFINEAEADAADRPDPNLN